MIFFHHFELIDMPNKSVAAAIILNVTYGHQVADGGDDYVTLADRALSSLAKAGIFGTYLVVRPPSIPLRS